MKLSLSLLALATALFISTTAFAQDQAVSLHERCAALKAQAPTSDATTRLCLGAKSQRLTLTVAKIELLVPGEIRNNFSVEVMPLKLTEPTNGQQVQTVAGELATLKVRPSPALPPESPAAVRTFIETKTDPEANAVSIHWRFVRGVDADGKPIAFDTIVLMKLSDLPESNVTTITPAK